MLVASTEVCSRWSLPLLYWTGVISITTVTRAVILHQFLCCWSCCAQLCLPARHCSFGLKVTQFYRLPFCPHLQVPRPSPPPPSCWFPGRSLNVLTKPPSRALHLLLPFLVLGCPRHTPSCSLTSSNSRLEYHSARGPPWPWYKQQPCPALRHRSARLITADAGPDRLADPLYVGSLLWAELFPHPNSRVEVPALGTSECGLQTEQDPTVLAPHCTMSSACL